MNKTVTAVLAISALAVNVAGATSNNTVGGTNNTISTNSTSSAVWGFQNSIDANNALAFGTNNAVTGENGFAGGNNATAAGRNSFAFGSHAESTDAVAFGNNTIADRANSVAIGTNAVTDDAAGVDGIDLNGTRHIFAGEQPGAVVSFGSKARTGAGGVAQYNRQLQNVSAGRVEADSLDAVNGSQLFAAYDEINSLGTKVRTNTSDISTLQATSADHEGRITALEQRTYNMAGEINNRINATEQRINKLGADYVAEAKDAQSRISKLEALVAKLMAEVEK